VGVWLRLGGLLLASPPLTALLAAPMFGNFAGDNNRGRYREAKMAGMVGEGEGGQGGGRW
jgi:hypothetical protein